MSYKNFFITLLQVLCIHILLRNVGQILSSVLSLNELVQLKTKEELTIFLCWFFQTFLVLGCVFLLLRYTERFLSSFLKRERWDEIMLDVQSKDLFSLGVLLVCGYTFIQSSSYLIAATLNSFELKVNVVLNSDIYYPGKEIRYHIIQWILTSVLFIYRNKLIRRLKMDVSE